MGTVIELDETDESALDGSTDERLGGRYLADEPLAASVGDNEQVAFVIVSKRGGVTVERAGETETYKPGRSYRTLVAVTDVRVLIAVGGADDDGDRIVSVPLSTVVDVDTESSFLGGSLVITTAADETWSIPCRDDLGAVRSYLERAQQAWSKTDRLLTEIDERIEVAEDHLAEGNIDAALTVASDAHSMIAQCKHDLDEFEMQRGVLDNAGFDGREASIRAVQRQAHAETAAQNRHRARDALDQQQYRKAYELFEDALQAHERALAVDAEEPADDELTRRQQATEREVVTLVRTPAAAAADALEEARAVEDPTERAEALEGALDSHRDLLSLCWGPEAAFEGDPDAIRERIVDIVDEIVAARIATARRSLVAADRLTVRDRYDEAHAECDQASEQLATARAVAAELCPDRIDRLDTWEGIVADQRDRIGSEDQPQSSADRNDETVVGGITTTETASTESPEIAEEEPAAVDSEGDDPETVEPGDDSLAAKLRALDQSGFTRLIADLWRALGWQTTAFTASVDQYDVMATREDPVELRMLVWAVHRPDGELDTAEVDRCATDRANVDRADVAALVTTASVPEAVHERAAEHNVKLLDRTELMSLLEREELDRLVDHPDG